MFSFYCSSSTVFPLLLSVLHTLVYCTNGCPFFWSICKTVYTVGCSGFLNIQSVTPEDSFYFIYLFYTHVYFYGHFEPKYMNNYEYNYFQSTVQSFLHLFISQSIILCVTVCPPPSSSLSMLCWVQDVLHQCWGVSFLVAFLISLFLLCLSKLSFSSILLLPFPLLAWSTHIAPLSTLLLLSTIYLTSTAP